MRSFCISQVQTDVCMHIAGRIQTAASLCLCFCLKRRAVTFLTSKHCSFILLNFVCFRMLIILVRATNTSITRRVRLAFLCPTSRLPEDGNPKPKHVEMSRIIFYELYFIAFIK
jgi:hypothetical protein